MSIRGTSALDELRSILGAEHVTDEPDFLRRYEIEPTGRFPGSASLVARPASTEQVSQTLAVLEAHRMQSVLQGGNTSLAGGATPRAGEAVVSLASLNELGPVDRSTATVVAGAGVTLEELQAHVRPSGLQFAIDHPARSSATVGGTIATDAGGAYAFRYGTARAQVAGLEAVLVDGRVIRQRSFALKDNAGYDLSALLCGSEGTLAAITRARLRLIQAFPHVATALFALDSLEQAVELVAVLRANAPNLSAVDFFLADGLELVRAHRSLRAPFAEPYAVYVVAECAAPTDAVEELAEAAEAADHLVRDVGLALDTADRSAFWEYREAHNESIRALGVPHKLDVGVPLMSLGRFVEEVGREITAAFPDARLIVYGHLGDGNLHVNVVGPPPEDESVDEIVIGLTLGYEGSISAEHGIGVAKTRWLESAVGAAGLEAMQSVKRALDPHGLLGRGRVLPD